MYCCFVVSRSPYLDPLLVRIFFFTISVIVKPLLNALYWAMWQQFPKCYKIHKDFFKNEQWFLVWFCVFERHHQMDRVTGGWHGTHFFNLGLKPRLFRSGQSPCGISSLRRTQTWEQFFHQHIPELSYLGDNPTTVLCCLSYQCLWVTVFCCCSTTSGHWALCRISVSHNHLAAISSERYLMFPN